MESGQAGSRVTGTGGPAGPASCGGRGFGATRPRGSKRRALVAEGFRGKVACADVFAAGCSRLALVVSSKGREGGSKELPGPRGAVQVRGRSFDRARGRRVGHTGSCLWPSPTTACGISCGSVSWMSLQVARSAKLTKSSTCRSARGAGLDELEPAVVHAPSAGLAGGDDGFVAGRSSLTVPQTVRGCGGGT